MHTFLAYYTNIMASFPPAAAALLDNIVEKGDVNELPPSRIMKDPAYSAMLANIPPGTFRSRLTRMCSKSGKPSSRKGKSRQIALSRT